MTLSDIQTNIYDRMGYGNPPSDTATVRRILGLINETELEIIRKRGMDKIRRRILPFSTVDGSPECVLPRAASRIYGIYDRSNQRPLSERGFTEIQNYDPGLTHSSANPEAFAIVNYSASFARQPSDSSQLLIKSSAAGDTTQTAYIEVIDSNGELKTASVTLTGTTAVNLGPSDSINIVDLYLSAVAVGTVTLHEDTGAGTELARIGIGRTRANYTQLYIYPTPTAASTLYADVDIAWVPMANANDEPSIPADFHYLIGIGARIKEYEKKEKMAIRKSVIIEEWNPGMSELRLEMHRRGIETQERRWSQLGGYYPVGS